MDAAKLVDRLTAKLVDGLTTKFVNRFTAMLVKCSAAKLVVVTFNQIQLQRSSPSSMTLSIEL